MSFQTDDIHKVFWSESGVLWGLTVKNQICEYQCSDEGELPSHPRRILEIGVDFLVENACFQKGGKRAVVYGYAKGAPVVAVLDVSASQPPGLGPREIVKCPFHVLPRDDIAGCPGVRICKVWFCPASSNVFAILGSNGRWVVYDVTGQNEPVTRSFRLDYSSSGHLGRNINETVSFLFGPSVGWGLVTVLFLRRDGKVFLVCPVAIHGLAIHQNQLRSMEQNATLVDKEWCSCVFNYRWVDFCSAQDLPEWWTREPMLQGPLNSESPFPDRLQDYALDMEMTVLRDGIRIFTVTEKGTVTEYYLAGDIEPAWTQSGETSGLYKPALAPNVVFRQGDGAKGMLKPLSRALVDRQGSSMKYFASLPGHESSIIYVVRDTGAYLITFPAFSLDCDDGLSQDDHVDCPIVECIHKGQPRKGPPLLGGFFSGEGVVVLGAGGHVISMAMPDLNTWVDKPEDSFFGGEPYQISPPSGSQDQVSLQALTQTIASMETHFRVLEGSLTALHLNAEPMKPSEEVASSSVEDLGTWDNRFVDLKEMINEYLRCVAPVGETVKEMREVGLVKPSYAEVAELGRRISQVIERIEGIGNDVDEVQSLHRKLMENGK